ncbi:hypothetical protein [Singulisphaera acidiphila]|uniref:Uncharacterized protein n=1 Tax=Singulisphaera acidiphila (strain ATCC BAA-1392 / DSM 18658 / VKM B-2454 / MOB10) TaxID=886293 RepID=L0DLR5_SINAD|nr:hypothetical protein [Singulisphaera acidiphila]AGA30324.1 hypothetical protein Sinac_6226 [Singulisphaera acidiphila DSM 18658]
MIERASVVVGSGLAGQRTVKSVPFVELAGGRVQGIVSSGSDIERVYVSFVESGSGDYYCCTNNNRPCGGLRGAPCKHIAEMVDEAILQFGAARVAAYLGLDGDEQAVDEARKILGALGGCERKEPPGVVFSRFLNYLRYCELTVRPGTVLEMGWFVS